MSSSILRFISEKEAAAASFLRQRISLSRNRGCSKLCGGVGGDSSLRRVSYSSPWLMLPPSFEKEGGSGMSYNFYSLAQNKVVSLKKNYSKQQSAESPNDDALLVGSSHGWLALYNRREGGLFLSNPVTGENIKLPPLDDLDINESLFDLNEPSFVRRVILSSPPHRQDCRAMLTFYGSRLAVCSPGRSSEWTEIQFENFHDDVVYSTTHRLFFGILDDDPISYELESWDPFSTKDEEHHRWWLTYLGGDEKWPHYGRTDRERKLLNLYTGPMRHLVHVEHADKLLLVKRHFVRQLTPDGYHIGGRDNILYPRKTAVFEVYIIDLSREKFCCMEDSLDGLVLFVGLNHSFAVPAAEFPELKPDSIYFTEYGTYSCPMACPEKKYAGHDIGIFDYKKKTISPCYYPCDYGSLKKIYPSPLWFTPSPH